MSEGRAEVAGRRRWWAVAGWATVILIGTTIPIPALSGVPHESDKVAHLLLYAPLGYLLMHALRGGGLSAGRAWLAAWGLGLLFGAFDEWHQQYFARHADFHDWVADGVGVALGGGLQWLRESIESLRR